MENWKEMNGHSIVENVSYRTLNRSTSLALCALLLLLFSCSDVDRTNPAGIDWNAKMNSSSSEGASQNQSSSMDGSSSVASSFSVQSSSSSSHGIIYGATFIDTRDSVSYPTVVIGTQTWMAKNLEYEPSSGNSWCYNDLPSNCTIYGRLYDWNTALTVCPTGWHLPSDAEWATLENAGGGSSVAGTKLRASSSLWITNNGTDEWGFSALPGGDRMGIFGRLGESGAWWTGSPGSAQYAVSRQMRVGSAGVGYNGGNPQANGLSVRCLKGAIAASSSSVVQSSSSAISSSSVVASNTQTCPYDSTAKTLSCTENVYRTVTIGTQVWMAQNLNYTPTSGNSWCYDTLASNCTTYGRLYDYTTALTVCPMGWHLPDTTAWNVLEAAVGGTATAGTKLKSSSALWTAGGIAGTDDNGFSALPGGYRGGSGFGLLGDYAYWWTSTPYSYGNNALRRYIGNLGASLARSSNFQTDGNSVRCLKD